MTAVQSRDVMVRPKFWRVFGHGWAGQEGTDGRSPNSAVHLVTGNPANQYGRLPNHVKVFNHLMFGVPALTVDQLMRLAVPP